MIQIAARRNQTNCGKCIEWRTFRMNDLTDMGVKLVVVPRRLQSGQSPPQPVRLNSTSRRAGPFGLTMVDYKTFTPSTWPLPPPPPLQKGAAGKVQQYLAPALASLFFVGVIYVSLYQDENIYEYWKQVEQGNVPIGDDDEDDNDDDEDEWEDVADVDKLPRRSGATSGGSN